MRDTFFSFFLAILELNMETHHPACCVTGDAFNLGTTMGTPRSPPGTPNSKEDPMETEFGPELQPCRCPGITGSIEIPKLMDGGRLFLRGDDG